MKLLHIDSSVLGSNSVSRQLTAQIVDQWVATHPGTQVEHLDLATNAPSHLSADSLGFRLPANFNAPYAARNLKEFWGRWHISLSTFIRDYVYIPLGGNRGPVWRGNLNMLLAMLISGLWHGASANFIIWGALHGVGLALYKASTYVLPQPMRWPGAGALP